MIEHAALAPCSVGAIEACLFAAAAAAAEPQHWHAFIDAIFLAIPMPVARLAPVALLVASGIGTLFVKRSYVYLGSPDEAWWRDLRLWSILCLIPYVIVYLWFG